MKKALSSRRGFTLIELLVVIAIIVLLTGIVVTNLTSSKSKARDAKRISDLGNIQLAIELYFDRCKSYPPALDPGVGCSTPTGSITLGTFISTIPKTPTGGDYGYDTDFELPPTDYMLEATLENPSSVLADDADVGISGTLDIECDDAGLHYCLGPR